MTKWKKTNIGPEVEGKKALVNQGCNGALGNNLVVDFTLNTPADIEIRETQSTSACMRRGQHYCSRCVLLIVQQLPCTGAMG